MARQKGRRSRRVLLTLLVVAFAWPATAQVGAKVIWEVEGRLGVSPLAGKSEDAVAPPEKAPEKPPEEPRPQPPRPARPASPAPVVTPESPIAVRYCLRRVDAAGRVLGDAPLGDEYRSGDRVQLSVEANIDGRLAIVQHGSDGHIGQLYPPPSGGIASTSIAARQPLILPGPRHSFTFDATPGTEHLWLVFGRDEAAMAALPLASEMDTADLEQLRLLVERESGAKNLVVETVSDPGEACTYAADLVGRLVVQEIALLHR